MRSVARPCSAPHRACVYDGGVGAAQHAVRDQARHLVAKGEEDLEGDGLLRRRSREILFLRMLQRGMLHHEGSWYSSAFSSANAK